MRIITSVIMLLLCYNLSFSQEGRALRIMFLNAENAFDIYDDPETLDDDFTPSGTRRWTMTRYHRKIDELYKTIASAGEWSSPEIVALCEIENRKVLLDLISGTFLSRFEYGIVHENSPDTRGIDVCLIYRKDKLRLLGYEYWSPPDDKEKFTSRNILHASFTCLNDTFHIIVNHWPSRRGGVLFAEELRMRISSVVRSGIDSIFKENPFSKILVTGDFNSNPGDNEIISLEGKDLINLSENVSSTAPGTYRYSGVWETIDQVIVSPGFLNCSKGLYTKMNSVTVFNPDFLLIKDPVYPGSMPYATYRGFRYQGGVSDHLPVLTDLFLH